MKYEDMLVQDGSHLGETKLSERNVKVSRMTVSVPPSCTQGCIYLDRLSFLKYRMQDQIAPDMQIPDNNHMRRNRIWQWGRLWEWEQYPEPDLKELTSEQVEMLEKVEQRMDEWSATGNPGDKYTATTLIPRADDL